MLDYLGIGETEKAVVLERNAPAHKIERHLRADQVKREHSQKGRKNNQKTAARQPRQAACKHRQPKRRTETKRHSRRRIGRARRGIFGNGNGAFS